MWFLWWWKQTQTICGSKTNQTDKTKAMKANHSLNEIQAIFKSVCSMGLKWEVWWTSVLGGFTIGSFSGFITDWVFDPAVSFFALIALILADHVSGMCLAWKNDKWETRKATRVFWTLLSHTALLAFANSLSRGSDVLFWMNEGIFVPLVMVNLISLVKNLSLLGYIKKDFARLLYRKIDTYKNEYIEGKKDSGRKPGGFPDDGC